MKISEAIKKIEAIAPLQYQESYDNAGLIIGNSLEEIQGILISLDVTEKIIDEAIERGCNLIVAHHPIIFSGLKKINGKNWLERTVLKAIKNDIAIYASHTNMDSSENGVSNMMCKKLGLSNCKILQALKDDLKKIVVFVPCNHAAKVRKAMFDAGAGTIGNYDSCSYNLEGKGSFRASEEANPFVGEKGKIHFEEETRVETIVSSSNLSKVISSMISEHPYEEVAYDVYPLENTNPKIGMGMIGYLSEEMDSSGFLKLLKEKFGSQIIRYTEFNKKIKKVALCGGSGIFLLKRAISVGADAFVTGDVKYHDFFEADEKLLLADIGHFESEQFTQQLFYEILNEKKNTFAVLLSRTSTNPIMYYK